MGKNGDKNFAEGTVYDSGCATIFDGETNTSILALKVDAYRSMYMRSIRLILKFASI